MMRTMRHARCGSGGWVDVDRAPNRGGKAVLFAAVLAGIGGMCQSVRADNQAWSLSPASNNFAGMNWTTSSTTPGAATGTINSGDSLYFGISSVTTLTNDETVDFALSGITFNSGASPFAISGNELDLSASPITDNASALQTISTPILLNGTPTVIVAGGSNLVLSGAVSGSGAFTKIGGGTLTLSGVFVYDPNNPFATSYSGTNVISAGRVVALNSASALGTASTNSIATGAVLELRNTTGANLNQTPTTFTGTGTIQKTGYGNFIFGGNGGNVTVGLSAGALIDIQAGQLIGSSSGQGKWTGNQASMNIASGASFEGDEAPIFIDALTGSGTYLGGYAGSTTTTIGVANGSGMFSGQLLDSRDGGGVLSLTKTGTGTEILTGTNTFSGNTNVTGGTLELDNNLSLEESVLNIPAAGTGSVVFGSGVTSTSMIFGGIGGSTNFTLQRGASPASLTLTGSGGANSVFTGALVGGTTLTKAGSGTQTLSGSNTYTGGTTILEGGLTLDYNANASNGGPIIPSTSSLTMGGTSGFIKNTLAQAYPVLQVQGSSFGAVTQTFNGLTLNVGSSEIAARGINGNTTTLALGAITHNVGGSILFNNLGDGVTGSQGVITTTSSANATTGLLGGWAVINAANTNSTGIQQPTAYATVSGGAVVPYTNYDSAHTYSDAATGTPFNTSNSYSANPNYKFVLNTNGTASSEYVTPNGSSPSNFVTTDVNTILLDASSTGRLLIDLGTNSANPSYSILRFGVDGGVLMGPANNTRTRLGYGSTNAYPGYITAGGPNNNTPGTLTVQSNNRIDIQAPIIDNGTGAVTVVYNIYGSKTDGSQTPTVNYTSNYSGGTYVNSGRIQVKASNALGTGPTYVSSVGQVYFSDGLTYNNNFFISGDAGNLGFYFDTPSALRLGNNDTITGNITLTADSTIVGSGVNNNLTGQITGNYNLQLNQNVQGAGAGNITLSNPNNSWGGDTILRGGSLVLTVPGALPAGTNLSIDNGGSVVDNAATVGKALSVGQLNFFGSVGKLELNNNEVIVHSSTLAAVTGLIQLGLNNGSFNGSAGIVSSTAGADTTHLTALGVIVNDNGTGTPLYGSGGAIASTFGGATPVDGDVLVKYTYFGDANLDGQVDGSDYSRIDSGFMTGATGWYNGDFNYDGVIDGSDYTLIDNAFNRQGAKLASEIASPTAAIATGTGYAAVPEPAALGLIGMSVAGLLGRRRRC